MQIRTAEELRQRAAERRKVHYSGKQATNVAGPATAAQKAAWVRYHKIIRPQREAACRACEHHTDGGCELLRTPGRRCDALYGRLLANGGAHPKPKCPWNPDT